MKRLIVIMPFIAIAAGAQEDQKLAQLRADLARLSQIKLEINGMDIGPAVKSAPYSGTEITEVTQVLGDPIREVPG